MRIHAITALLVVSVGAALLTSSGCATGGPPAPKGPVELNNTKWKLSIAGGRFDGRVVAFKKKGKDGYIGTLAEKGHYP
jgi:hypothetical protein